MAMSRIIKTLASRRPSILTFPRLFSAGSDKHEYEYSVCVRLPEEKRYCSKEEIDDWFHWYVSSSCSGSKAAAAPTKSSSSHRDPRILYTCPDGFLARLSVEDIYDLFRTDEFLFADRRGKIDYTVAADELDKTHKNTIDYRVAADELDKTHKNTKFHVRWK